MGKKSAFSIIYGKIIETELTFATDQINEVRVNSEAVSPSRGDALLGLERAIRGLTRLKATLEGLPENWEVSLERRRRFAMDQMVQAKVSEIFGDYPEPESYW